jgi:hypothetical protein
VLSNLPVLQANATMAVVCANKRGELQEFDGDMKFEIADELDKLWHYFGQKQPNDTQLNDAVGIILTTYPAMDITLFKLAMVRIKSAYYGKDSKAYGALNPQVVMHVLKLVWDEHEEHYEQELQNKRTRYNDALNSHDYDPTNIVDGSVISRYLEQRMRADVARQVAKETKLTEKISEAIEKRAMASMAIVHRQADAIEKTLDYLQRYEPEEYDDFVKKLEEFERKHGIR